MKIATTTFFQSQTNYGQLLQAYALQRILKKHGHSPYIIRYGFHEYIETENDNDNEIKESHWLNSCCDSVSIYGKYILNIFKYYVKNIFCHHTMLAPTDKDERGFDAFRQKHLQFSQYGYNSLDELQKNPPVADCYLTGSDQVWAQLLSIPNNRTFYLDFGPDNIRRIAYAPSFSLDAYPEELQDDLRHQLKRLNSISVREQTGVNICKKVGVNAKHVLDPTMLLCGKHYECLRRESTIVLPKHFVFVYHVNITKSEDLLWDKFQRYNESKKIMSIATHANGEGQNNMDFLENATYTYPTIPDWIKLIKKSQYVLTSSFHGMIFSILFHKPFFICLRPESMFAGNDRVMSILSLLGLEDRIATQDTDVEIVLQKKIDWKSVDKKLHELRKDSLNFLLSCLL